MRYGEFKYGEQKYGAFVSTGDAEIMPSKFLGFLTLYLTSVGNGAVDIAGSIIKSIAKIMGTGGINIVGNAAKLLYSITGAGAITSTGNIKKTISVTAGGVISSITGNITKLTKKTAGSGSVTILGVLQTLKYYFLVTIDQILQPFGLYVLRDTRSELIPSTRDNTETIPGKHGEIDFGSEFNSRVLELHVASPENLSPLEKEQNKRLYAKHLNPVNGVKQLVFEDDPDKQYNVKFAGKIDVNPQGNWFDFVIPFKMSDPFIQSTDEHLQTGAGTIVNAGTFETPILIEVPGLATNPSISVGATVIAYASTVAAGQTLIIDTDTQTAKIGSINAMAAITGDVDYMLAPQVSVIVTPSISGTLVKWNDKWL